jgi:hypothetical protein
MSKLLFEDEPYKIRGACMLVHKDLVTRFLGSVCHEGLETGFNSQKINLDNKQKL